MRTEARLVIFERMEANPLPKERKAEIRQAMIPKGRWY